MVDEAEQLISETVQIKNQYVAEVGEARRRAWPKSIKERVARLDDIGVAPKVVAARTLIPYDTIVLWRYNRRHGAHGRLKKGFHELTVARHKSVQVDAAPPVANGILKSLTVTVPDTKIPHTLPGPTSTPSLRITTPNGFIVEGLDETRAVQLIRQLTDLGGHRVI